MAFMSGTAVFPAFPGQLVAVAPDAIDGDGAFYPIYSFGVN
jgi:hypothetical protein